MKRCPKCEGYYPDDIQICSNCIKSKLVDSKDFDKANKEYQQAEDRQRNLHVSYSMPPQTSPHQQTAPPQVSCPKCGSTQIQAVTRKWSLITGFLTNKVDRVCLNCKHKF